MFSRTMTTGSISSYCDSLVRLGRELDTNGLKIIFLIFRRDTDFMICIPGDFIPMIL